MLGFSKETMGSEYIAINQRKQQIQLDHYIYKTEVFKLVLGQGPLSRYEISKQILCYIDIYIDVTFYISNV